MRYRFVGKRFFFALFDTRHSKGGNTQNEERSERAICMWRTAWSRGHPSIKLRAAILPRYFAFGNLLDQHGIFPADLGAALEPLPHETLSNTNLGCERLLREFVPLEVRLESLHL